MKHIKLYEGFINEGEIRPHQQEMYDGIVDIIKRVKDLKNREEIAEYMFKDLKKEEIEVDKDTFFKDCGIKSNMEDVLRDFQDKIRELRKFPAMGSNTKSIKAAKEVSKEYKIKYQEILKTAKPDNNIAGEKTWDKDGNIK